MANILRRHGRTVFGDHDDEVSIQCDPNTFPRSLDLCALSDQGVTIVEIDGYRGHSSGRAIHKDAHRTDEIINHFKKNGLKAKVYRFAFWQLVGMDDATIAKELELVQDQTQG